MGKKISDKSIQEYHDFLEQLQELRKDDKITDEDMQRMDLLFRVNKYGLKSLNLRQLDQLIVLLKKKDYSHDKKAQKSKSKLLAKINAEIYEKEEGIL
jgi:membrane-associated HD superfamily phosphohydrolase